MKIVKQQPTAPNALRVLVTAADDADGIEFALAAASRWLDRGRTLVVVNATGRDLAGFARRYEFSVVCDDAGRPSRSLAEISEAFESLNRAEVGAVVVLDTNRIYRATRCAVRDIDSIKSLSPGHWDDTNESLGRATETLTRAGIPSIFVAPPSDIYGVDDDGEQVVVGSKPQAWKDLPRQSHVMLTLTASGVTVTLDDHRVLPRRIEGGEQLGDALAELARGSTGGASGTTLAEATAAELAARARLASRRRQLSEQTRDRLIGLALLRAHQGHDAWTAHVQEVALARSVLLPDDVDIVDQTTSKMYSEFAARMRWQLTAEKMLEMSPYGLHVSWPDQVPGPDPGLVPRHEAVDITDLLASGTLPTLGERPIGLIAALARAAGVWEPVRFASVCRSAMPERLVMRGPNWDDYGPGALQPLALLLWQLALAATRYENVEPQPRAVEPPVAAPPPVKVALVEPTQAEPKDEMGKAIAGMAEALSRHTDSWPTPEVFLSWTERRQRDELPHYLHRVGAFADWDDFRRASPRIGRSSSSRRWDRAEIAAIYLAAYARREHARTEAA